MDSNIEDKEELILQLFLKEESSIQIAKKANVSLRDVNKYIRNRLQKIQNLQAGQSKESLSSQAYRLFSEGTNTLDVAIKLNIRENEANQYYKEYNQLKLTDHLSEIIAKLFTNNEIRYFIDFYEILKSKSIGVKEIPILIKIANDLSDADLLLQQKLEDVRKIEDKRYQLEQDIKNLSISIEAIRRDCRTNSQLYNYYIYHVEKLKEEIQNLHNIINKIKEEKEYTILVEKIKEIVREQFKDLHSLMVFVVIELVHYFRNPERQDSLYQLIKSIDNLSSKEKEYLFGYEVDKENLLEKDLNNITNNYANFYSVTREIDKISDFLLKSLEKKNISNSLRLSS